MIKEIVEGLKELSMSSNPFDICDYLEITVVEEYLGDEILGYYQMTKSGYEVLHINNKLNYHHRKYICAHELGHAILEPDLAISFFIENPLLIQNKFEIAADKFAAELLIDDNVLHKIEYENFTLGQIALAENVTIDLLKLKFNIE